MPADDEVAKMKVRWHPHISWEASSAPMRPGAYAPSGRDAARRTRDDVVLFGMLALYALGAAVIAWFLLVP